jgi:2-oxoglutarate dehydrogenase E2 component (dihydrolipoamide succinyltransferase)
MASEIRVPELGESVVEATVAEWLKMEGDPVKTGEAIVRLETDKVDVEVSAEQDGVLAKILRQQGDDVRVGEILGSIEASTEADKEGARAEAPQAAAESAPADGGEEGKISPLARRVAEELGVDVTQVPPGQSGRVTREDVETFATRPRVQPAAPPVAPAAAAPGLPATQARPAGPGRGSPRVDTARATSTQPWPGRPEERVRLSRRRQTIARRLVEAQQTAAMLTTFNEVDMSAVMAMRAKYKESFKERHGIGLGFMSFFVKGSIGALKAFPQVNAELQGDELVLKHFYDIGIAIGAEEGLVVPVVRDADRMTFAQIEQAIETLAKKTREGTLSLEDLRGGTFTITNGGVFGSLLSTPILNLPQVVIRPMMYVALSYDHRVIDGREAVQFLVRLKTLIEDPEALLLEG